MSSVRSDIGPFAIVPEWVMDRCTPSELMVYIALALYADRNTSTCFPSFRKLTERTGFARATVARLLDGLREKGCVDWEQRDRKDGGQTSNLYTVYTSRPVDPPVSRVRPPRLTSETPPGVVGETGPVSRVTPQEPEPTTQSHKNNNHHQAAPAGAAGPKGRNVATAIGAEPGTQRDLDELPARPAKRQREERPQRERKRSPLDLLADRFRDVTLDALSGLGRNSMLLLAFNRGAMLKSFSALMKDKGQTAEDLQRLIDQWAIDVRVGNIHIPENVAPWKVFLRQLDAINGRVREKQATGRDKTTGPSLDQIMEERTKALLGV